MRSFVGCWSRKLPRNCVMGSGLAPSVIKKTHLFLNEGVNPLGLQSYAMFQHQCSQRGLLKVRECTVAATLLETWIGLGHWRLRPQRQPHIHTDKSYSHGQSQGMLAQFHIQVREEDPSFHCHLPLLFVHLKVMRVSVRKIRVSNPERYQQVWPSCSRETWVLVPRVGAEPLTWWMILVIEVNQLTFCNSCGCQVTACLSQLACCFTGMLFGVQS